MLGEEVGYAVRFDEALSTKTKIKVQIQDFRGKRATRLFVLLYFSL